MSSWWKNKRRLPNGHRVWAECYVCGFTSVVRTGQKRNDDGSWRRERLREMACSNCANTSLRRVSAADARTALSRFSEGKHGAPSTSQ